MLAVMGLVSLLMGLFVFQVFGRNVPADVAIALMGSKTTGTIVSQTVDGRMAVDHVHPTTFEFSYVVSGTTFKGRSYAVIVPAQLAYTQKCDIEYLSFEPEAARVAGTTRNEGGDSIGWFIAAMIGFGASTIGVPWWFMRRKRRVFTSGASARGTMTFIGDSSIAINGRHPKKIAWSFEDERGRPFSGSLTAMMSSDLPPFQMGEPVTVLYDPNDPSANIVYID